MLPPSMLRRDCRRLRVTLCRSSTGSGIELAKRGIDYQELVGIIESAFDPGAEVKVGEWVEGPDGSRDCDVSIRDTRDGLPYFAFAECKDWKKRAVGIGTIDALDSKRKDLRADLTAIYSNSGFTVPAIQKARRVGINTFSAVASGDPRSRARVNALAYGRVVEPTSLDEQTIEPPGQDLPVPAGISMETFCFEGEPVHNWAVEQLGTLITEHLDKFEHPSQMVAVYQFHDVVVLDAAGVPFPVVGMRFELEIAVRWMAKALEIEAELGRFDAQTGLIWVPPNVPMTFWGLDDTGWEPVDKPAPEEVQNGESVRISVWARLQAGLIRAKGGVPDLTKHVAGMSLTISTPDP